MQRNCWNTRRTASMTAAGFIGVMLLGVISAPANARGPEVVVKGQRLDPLMQRRVYYGDLNLALRPQQKIFKARVHATADNLCGPALGYEFKDYDQLTCVGDAVASTGGQVSKIIRRAERQMAGLPVGPAIAISIVVNGR